MSINMLDPVDQTGRALKWSYAEYDDSISFHLIGICCQKSQNYQVRT